MAGQRVRLMLESGAASELHIASCPCNGRNLHFSVRRDRDAFSRELFQRNPTRALVTVTGPYGNFVLDEDSHAPAVFIAIDDGIAPIKSLIEHAVSIDSIEAFHLYWSAPDPTGHYHERWCRALKDALDNFTFTPLVNAAPEDLLALLEADLPRGIAERGPAAPAAAEGAPAQALRYYLAGPAAAIDAIAAALGKAGVAADRIAAEALD
jgi:CDP-4-dehydro-6-deoxyglucose reductase